MPPILIAERRYDEAGNEGTEESHCADHADIGFRHAVHIQLLNPVLDIEERTCIDFVRGECLVVAANCSRVARSGVLELELA